MSSIIKNTLNVDAARSFFDKFSANSHYLYATLGKSSAWINDSLPSIALDNAVENAGNYSQMWGASLLSKADMCMAVPRHTWTSGVVYRVRGNINIDPDITNTYCVNSQNNVYQCITASGVSTYEPTGFGSNIALPDGLHWKFLYDLSNNAANNLMTKDWLPINYGTNALSDTKVTTQQTASGDVNAAINLSAKWMIFRHKFLDVDLPFSTFRQACIVIDPLLTSGVAATAANYTTPATQWATFSGNLIYSENRSPITRVPGQFEEIKMVLRF